MNMDTASTEYAQARLARKCALAVVYYHKGVWGKAFGLCKQLGQDTVPPVLVQALQMQLAPFNGRYQSQETFLTSFLHIDNGTLTLANAFLNDGQTLSSYELQFEGTIVYARNVLPDPSHTVPNFVLRFSPDYKNVYITTVDQRKSGYTGMYYRI